MTKIDNPVRVEENLHPTIAITCANCEWHESQYCGGENCEKFLNLAGK